MTTNKALKPTNEANTTAETVLTFADFDKLNLKSFATQSLLQSIEKGVASPIGEQGAWTISLNAEFGNGKTTFLKMFQHFIETDTQTKQDYNVIFINAWESDFYGEPIITILSEFVELIENNAEIKDNEKKELKDTIIKVCKIAGNNKAIRLIGSVANQVIRNKTGIDAKETLNDMNNTQTSENSNQVDILEELIYIKKTIKELKTMLQKHTEKKKLIIIVDELDRARPDYAVHFLEDIKHFFDIPNVIFIVGVNRQQMESTVKCLYGESLNFEGYYRKFFKQEIDLPDPYKEAQKFVNTLIKEINLPPENHNIEAYLSCKTFNLTLREIEMFMRIFGMILGIENKNINWMQLHCYCFFICLSIKEKEEFNKILEENYTVNHFLKFLYNKKIDYKNSQFKNLLPQVATSFIKNQDSMDEERVKIKTEFNIIHPEIYIQDIYNRLNFGHFPHQPAVFFCKNIILEKP